MTQQAGFGRATEFIHDHSCNAILEIHALAMIAADTGLLCQRSARATRSERSQGQGISGSPTASAARLDEAKELSVVQGSAMGGHTKRAEEKIWQRGWEVGEHGFRPRPIWPLSREEIAFASYANFHGEEAAEEARKSGYFSGSKPDDSEGAHAMI